MSGAQAGGRGGRALVVFDVDGTLIDSERIILASQEALCAAFGIAHPGRERGLGVVGLSLPLAFEALLGPEAPIEAMTVAYKDIFAAMREDPAYREPLFPGVEDTLAALAGRGDVLLGIATGKSRRGIAHTIERHGWEGLFATVQTADDAPSKPHPGMLERAMGETGIRPGRTMMVGDSSYDVGMARAAGCLAVAVSWGFQPVDRLVEAGAERVIARMDEVPALTKIRAG